MRVWGRGKGEGGSGLLNVIAIIIIIIVLCDILTLNDTCRPKWWLFLNVFALIQVDWT